MVSFSCQHHRPNPVLCGLQSSICLASDINTQHKTASDRHSHHGDKSLTVREQLWLRIQSHLLTEWPILSSSTDCKAATQVPVQTDWHLCSLFLLSTHNTSYYKFERGVWANSQTFTNLLNYHLSHNLIQILHFKKVLNKK